MSDVDSHCRFIDQRDEDLVVSEEDPVESEEETLGPEKPQPSRRSQKRYPILTITLPRNLRIIKPGNKDPWAIAATVSMDLIGWMLIRKM